MTAIVDECDAQTISAIEALQSGELTAQEVAEHTKSLVGFTYTVDDYYEVGRQEIRKHARAVQDDHPVYWDIDAAVTAGHETMIAAPTFVSVLGLIAQRRLFEDVITGYDMWQIMQTDQRLEFHQPIRLGDRLVCDVSLESFRQSMGADLLVSKNIIWNQYDEPVMTTHTSVVARAAADVDPDLVATLGDVMMHVDSTPAVGKTVFGPFDRYDDPDPAVEPKAYGAIDFDTLEVGQELPVVTKSLTLGNLVNYAGVAGDPNPIHFSPEVARALGLESVVAHGMQTMGLGASVLGAFVGDPGAIYEYNVRFTSPVYVPPVGAAHVDFTGRIKSLDPETRRGVIALVGKQGDRKIFGRAQAKVQFN
ncbi:fused (3R)-hydroxyacyl-ACP dehydratase subunits HadA/HadB [Gordonia shandongensis]|uniref:fused (3R)-hydroxyacyl-ACP dehydratase subunits HadA/HadB n=1 Tax=Gordonia shandongensis TaxID=376351 RepID=UPI00047B675F|nr:fused (3R)-hydroxyacyl-ACP dehydratase subunits HadA/HadB [Gordonia shandongensis]